MQPQQHTVTEHSVPPIHGEAWQDSIQTLRWMRDQLTLAMPSHTPDPYITDWSTPRSPSVPKRVSKSPHRFGACVPGCLTPTKGMPAQQAPGTFASQALPVPLSPGIVAQSPAWTPQPSRIPFVGGVPGARARGASPLTGSKQQGRESPTCAGRVIMTSKVTGSNNMPRPPLARAGSAGRLVMASPTQTSSVEVVPRPPQARSGSAERLVMASPQVRTSSAERIVKTRAFERTVPAPPIAQISSIEHMAIESPHLVPNQSAGRKQPINSSQSIFQQEAKALNPNDNTQVKASIVGPMQHPEAFILQAKQEQLPDRLCRSPGVPVEVEIAQSVVTQVQTSEAPVMHSRVHHVPDKLNCPIEVETLQAEQQCVFDKLRHSPDVLVEREIAHAHVRQVQNPETVMLQDTMCIQRTTTEMVMLQDTLCIQRDMLGEVKIRHAVAEQAKQHDDPRKSSCLTDAIMLQANAGALQGKEKHVESRRLSGLPDVVAELTIEHSTVHNSQAPAVMMGQGEQPNISDIPNVSGAVVLDCSSIQGKQQHCSDIHSSRAVILDCSNGAVMLQDKDQRDPDKMCGFPSLMQSRMSPPHDHTNCGAPKFQDRSSNFCNSVALRESTDKTDKHAQMELAQLQNKTLEMNDINEIEAHHELDQAAVLREMRFLEVTLAEERQRTKDNEIRFNAKLEAQREAHDQDIKQLENMVKHALAENKRLAFMVAAWEEKEKTTSPSRSGTPMTISSACSDSSSHSKAQDFSASNMPLTPELPEVNIETPSGCSGSDSSMADSDDGSSISD